APLKMKESLAQVLVGDSMPFVDSERLPVSLCRLVVKPLLDQRISQIVAGGGVAGVPVDYFPVAACRLRVAPLSEVDIPLVEPGRDHFRVQIEGHLVKHQG